ncbi:MAG: SMC-Scp complex subunit ScpB [Chlorobium sp.]
MIEVRRRADSPGKPLHYGTSTDFLDLVHLSALKDLPKLREIKEILQEKEEQDYLTRPDGIETDLSGNNQEETIHEHEKEQQG